ncbi:ABC-type multidrug transport system ATPase subunit [Metabacillus malikii]|uniref:ABC-type multidrug transport system ATPase subunit n=1 Tax=Metabacillus malikii TaxID=1504265 RepID=A0ABT9ZCZ5_9BACI|nr:ABC-type multidrug transport system ATPase subunit [Metabacillus malikii]
MCKRLVLSALSVEYDLYIFDESTSGLNQLIAAIF